MKYLVLIAALAAAVGNVFGAPPTFRVVTLRDPGVEPIPYWNAAAMNIHGEVVATYGEGYGQGHPLPYYWDRHGEPHAIPLRADPNALAVANAINDRSEIAGYVSRGTGGVAFVYSAAKGFRRIGTDGYFANAYGINNAGQVVGQFNPRAWLHHPNEAVTWTREQGQQPLLPLPPEEVKTSAAWAINNRGQVLLNINATRGDQRTAVLEPDGSFTVLPETGRRQQVVGQALSNAGAVAGVWYSGYYEHAFLWEGAEVVDLGVIGGTHDDWTIHSYAFGVNRAGQVVGYSEFKLDPPGYRSYGAFYYDKLNGMLKLSDLIDPGDPLAGKLRLHTARAINDRGWILVEATQDAMESWGRRPVILVPTQQQGVSNGGPLPAFRGR